VERFKVEVEVEVEGSPQLFLDGFFTKNPESWLLPQFGMIYRLIIV